MIKVNFFRILLNLKKKEKIVNEKGNRTFVSEYVKRNHSILDTYWYLTIILDLSCISLFRYSFSSFHIRFSATLTFSRHLANRQFLFAFDCFIFNLIKSFIFLILIIQIFQGRIFINNRCDNIPIFYNHGRKIAYFINSFWIILKIIAHM